MDLQEQLNDAADAIERLIAERDEAKTDLAAVGRAYIRDIEKNEPKRGEWIYLYEGNYKCSVCGAWYGVDETPVKAGMEYCPNCGSQMRGEVNERD